MEPFFTSFRSSPEDVNFATRSVAAAGRALKNTDLTYPHEELPHHYYNAKQRANKSAKTP